MSLYGLVHPEKRKCQSGMWSFIRAQQLAPGANFGLTAIDTRFQCDFNETPYTNPAFAQEMRNELSLNGPGYQIPYKIWGYPNTNQQGKLAPIVYFPQYPKRPVINYAMAANSYTI